MILNRKERILSSLSQLLSVGHAIVRYSKNCGNKWFSEERIVRTPITVPIISIFFTREKMVGTLLKVSCNAFD